MCRYRESDKTEPGRERISNPHMRKQAESSQSQCKQCRLRHETDGGKSKEQNVH